MSEGGWCDFNLNYSDMKNIHRNSSFQGYLVKLTNLIAITVNNGLQLFHFSFVLQTTYT